MPVFRFKSMLGVLLGLCVLEFALCGGALAENAVSFNEIGIRYYATEDEMCLTRDQLPVKALQLLGVNAETMLQAMERDNLFLVCLTSDGRQVSLRGLEKPREIAKQNSFQLTELEREQFLALLSLSGHYLSACWQATVPGFALFSTQGADETAEQNDASPPLHTIALSTLYLDAVYSFQTDIIGRMPTEADVELLLSAAKRTLLLGAAEATPLETRAEPAPITLPQQTPLTEEMVAFTQEIGASPLSLSPIPCIIPATSFTLSGEASPNAFVRYSVNGIASSRFKAAADGTFSVTVPNLTPDEANAIEVTAFDQAQTSKIRFEVTVSWQATPLVLSQIDGEVQGESFMLYGATLPGAMVQLIRRSDTKTLSVQPDGGFSYNVPLPKVGENTFTLRAVSTGYRRTDMEVTITRKAGIDDEIAALRRKIKPVGYQKLIANPAAYKDRTVEWSGIVTLLQNVNQEPCFLLELAPNQSILCFCPNLLNVELGQSITLLGTLLGESKPLNAYRSNEAYPAMKLLIIVP